MLKSKWAFEVSQIIHWTLLFPILIVQDSLTEGYPQSNVKSVKIAAIFRIYRTEILSSLRLFFCLWSGSENPRVDGSIPSGGTKVKSVEKCCVYQCFSTLFSFFPCILRTS